MMTGASRQEIAARSGTIRPIVGRERRRIAARI